MNYIDDLKDDDLKDNDDTFGKESSATSYEELLPFEKPNNSKTILESKLSAIKILVLHGITTLVILH